MAVGPGTDAAAGVELEDTAGEEVGATAGAGEGAGEGEELLAAVTCDGSVDGEEFADRNFS